MALAANEGANPVLLEQLQKKDSIEENVEWFTPQSEEEIQAVLSQLEGLPT